MENENLNSQVKSINNGNKGLMIVLIVIGLILIGMVGYKIFADSSNGKQEPNDQSVAQEKNCNCPKCDECEKTECPKCDECEKTECLKCESTTSEQNSLKSANGKIIVKRNGIAKLESVPSDIVGKYVNDAGDYYKLNSDGTAEIYANTGCSDCGSNDGLISAKEVSFQLSYVGSSDDQTVIVEFYLNSKSHTYVPGKAIYGFKWQGAYRFNVIDNTPTSTVGETIFDKK